MIEKITWKNIREVFEEKGYDFFEGGDFNLNIVVIRTENSHSNSFDDYLAVLHKENGKPLVHVWPITTDPGKHWLMNPLNKNGTIIVVPGQHKGAYMLGIHGRSGKYPYEALEQKKPMSYVRDNNRDNKLTIS